MEKIILYHGSGQIVEFPEISETKYVARVTKNRRADIVKYLSKKNIEHQLKVAEVNHCLNFEQVSDEWIEQYGI